MGLMTLADALWGIINTLLAFGGAVLMWSAYGRGEGLAVLFYICTTIFFSTLALDGFIPDGVPDDRDDSNDC